jgi:hypothetical protein
MHIFECQVQVSADLKILLSQRRGSVSIIANDDDGRSRADKVVGSSRFVSISKIYRKHFAQRRIEYVLVTARGQTFTYRPVLDRSRIHTYLGRGDVHDTSTLSGACFEPRGTTPSLNSR